MEKLKEAKEEGKLIITIVIIIIMIMTMIMIMIMIMIIIIIIIVIIIIIIIRRKVFIVFKQKYMVKTKSTYIKSSRKN